MCFDGEPPRVFRETTRRARVPHACDECGDAIPAGATYEYVSGVWDGRGASYATCLRCVALRRRVIAHEEAEGCYGTDAYPPLGDLWASALECEVITHAEYARARGGDDDDG